MTLHKLFINNTLPTLGKTL